MIPKNYLTRYYKESDYAIIFNQVNGTFIRLGKNNIDPFYNKIGPELLDISITNYCERGCIFCYRKSNKGGRFILLDDYTLVMKQAQRAGVLQVALGGGNPNQHPQFSEILNITRNYNIIPSYTTNGQGMTDEIFTATKNFCGAMAVSWYEPYFDSGNVIDQAIHYGITVNVHFLLSNNSLSQAIELIEKRQDILEKINALIFLNYKPIHSPESFCLTDCDEIKHFFDLIKKTKTTKIGFDSCMVSYLPLLGEDLVVDTVDFCEAGRFSGYISEDLLFFPCSFFNDVSQNGVNLKTSSLEEGWQNGEEFIKIRYKLGTPAEQNFPITSCKTCKSYDLCHGGCQIFNINRCRT
jgi:radical SAM protein with 4Fe4S-binding SPASM domain